MWLIFLTPPLLAAVLMLASPVAMMPRTLVADAVPTLLPTLLDVAVTPSLTLV